MRPRPAVGTQRVAKLAGVTFRQLNHWCVRGFLLPKHDGGTGHDREWPAAEVAVARLMARLVAAGFRPEHAASIARTAVVFDVTEVEVGEGLTLTVK
ncbi:MerR family transcriptional regulator [Microtetraspora niveoalba]|uniref:MerR family transcriptional regulator n=1 Tax=Microtetraspora niveoalba TaxID=46175 RepID=UPI00083289D6|nr:MerR family transcriptional regulator [Microtetraspora niveoalba]